MKEEECLLTLNRFYSQTKNKMSTIKKYFTYTGLMLCSIFFWKISFAQPKERSYVTSRFTLQLDGSPKGFIKPVEKGDTLIYAIDRLADSILVRKKFDSTFGSTGRRYYLQYRLKKKLAGMKTTRKPE